MKNKILRLNREISNKNKLFYVITAAAAVACFIAGIATNGNTISNLLFNKDDIFMDFFNSVVDCSEDAYAGEGVIYPPLTVLFYKLCSLFFDTASMKADEIRSTSLGMLMFVLITLICYLFLAKLLYKYKNGSKFERLIFLASVLLSFPMVYLIERGNILILVVVLLLYYIYGYDSEKAFVRHTSYICLAICVAIKIYPVVFGLLLLKKKNNLKNILWCIFYGVLFFFVPFLFVGGFSQLFVLINNILYTSSMFGSKGYGYKVNITNTFELFGEIFNRGRLFETAGNVVLLLTVVIGLLLILFANFKEQWKLYAVISLILVLVPGFSYIYSIVYMIIPLLYFLNERKTKKLDYVYAALFALQFIFIIATKDELFPEFNSEELNLNISTVIESLALLVMLVLLYIEGIISVAAELKGKKLVRLPANAAVCAALAAVVAFTGVFSIYYTPSKSGFSITSVECFSGEDDETTLNEFYSYTASEIGSEKAVAFPRIDFLTEMQNENLSFYDLSYYDNSIKKLDGIKKYAPSYIVIYNASRADIRDTDMQISYTELKTYLEMYKGISKYCWSRGYEKIKAFSINDGIELSVWKKTDEKKNTSWNNGGSGKRDDPYLISTPQQLYYFSEYVNAGNSLNNKYVELTNDIDMSSIDSFTPIGFEVNNNYFKGTFNGNGYSIKNLTMIYDGYSVYDSDENYIKYDIALFGKLAGTVSNLVIEDSTFKGYCSAVFARSSLTGDNCIINCVSRNNIIEGARSGELVDDYAGKIYCSVGIDNVCKGTGYENIIGYKYTNPETAAVYTNTYYSEYSSQNKFYLPENIILNQDMADTLNSVSNAFNHKMEVRYLNAVHRLCYNGGKKIEDLKTPKPLKLSEWQYNDGMLSLSHK